MRLASTILLLLSCITSHAMQQESRFYAAGLNDQEVETFSCRFAKLYPCATKRKLLP